jgi:tetratricopeptide (TPR) repeat protein
LALDPEYQAARTNLGIALQQAGRLEEAAGHHREVVRAQPSVAAGHYNLGAVLLQQGETAEAVDHLREAIRLRPGYAAALQLLGGALGAAGSVRESIRQYRAAIEAAPDWPVPMVSLAWLLATSPDEQVRRPGEALILTRRAAQLLGGSSAAVFDTLAASFAALGDFKQAVASAEAALASTSGATDGAVAAQIRERLALYRAGVPYVAPR